MTFEWETLSYEERALAITNIDLMFPSQFLPSDLNPSGIEAGVVRDLRTQVFVQLYLENLNSVDNEDWSTEERTNEIFKLFDVKKQRKPTHQMTPAEKVLHRPNN